MRIHEVCQATGLTKKAINWYEEQGLIAIPTDENGYRDFQDADIQKLKEIGWVSVPRKLKPCCGPPTSLPL